LRCAADLVHYSQHQIKEAIISIRINVGLSKKIGQPDYGSLGASCHVEMEVENGDREGFQNAVRKAYAACREAVEKQLAMNGSAESRQRVGLQHVAEPVNRIVNRVQSTAKQRGPRLATPAQLRAIYAITNRNGVELAGLLGQFKVSRPDDLSVRHASRLIDQLKNKKGDALGSSQQT